MSPPGSQRLSIVAGSSRSWLQRWFTDASSPVAVCKSGYCLLSWQTPLLGPQVRAGDWLHSARRSGNFALAVSSEPPASGSSGPDVVDDVDDVLQPETTSAR